MTRDEAIAFIKFGLGNRTGTELDQAIIARLKEAQALLEQGRSLPYFLVEEDAPLGISAGSTDVAFPTGFLREVQFQTVYQIDQGASKHKYLIKVNPEEGAKAIGLDPNGAGPPIAYSIMKDGFRFYPTRDKAYQLFLSYYKQGSSLDTNVADNAWLVYAPYVLIGRAGSLIAEVIAHDRAKAAFDAQFAAAWSAAFAEGVLRDEENDPLYLGAKL